MEKSRARCPGPALKISPVEIRKWSGGLAFLKNEYPFPNAIESHSMKIVRTSAPDWITGSANPRWKGFNTPADVLVPSGKIMMFAPRSSRFRHSLSMAPAGMLGM